ncbi:cytochrome b/b6 domain-containing protein [Hyphococcus sp.]|uniref:cytochrome b/b6 domain-containing protein n=1 Tax=Hyphococcus sp. TaxID=2038636 RepID=UPI0035C77B70
MGGARYNPVAAIFHWTIAALIIGQIIGGKYMHGLPNASPLKFDLYQLHKSFGLTILLLSLVRLGWRLTHQTPALPAAMPNWQKLLARGTHWAFYALMILTPLAGWAIVSVSPTDIPTKWFGLFPVPHLPFFNGVTDREAAEHIMEERHELLAYLILGLLVLHVGAALKHAFVDKDGVFTSMVPAGKGPWLGIASVFAMLGAASLLYLSSGPAPTKTPTSGARSHSSNARGGNWIVDYGQSELSFVGSENGKEFRGAFENFQADIEFNPDDLENAEIRVVVSTASASTGDSLRDSNLPGSEWFDVKNHPQATFETSEVKALGGGNYTADGTLIIKDIERPVTLQFELDIEEDNALARGHADLMRTDFSLGENASWLDDEGVAVSVRVEFDIHAVRKD